MAGSSRRLVRRPEVWLESGSFVAQLEPWRILGRVATLKSFESYYREKFTNFRAGGQPQHKKSGEAMT